MDSRRSDRNNARKNGYSTKTKILIVALGIVLAVVGLAGGYIVGLLNKVDRVEIDKNNLGVNKKLTQQYSYIENIALFGIDNEEGVGRSDSMMILTVDTKHNKLKVTSLMRDSYVAIQGHGEDKLNSAYAYGKEELAIKTINENFDLNIESFATVDFSTLPKVIDQIGGIDLEIDENEIKYLNEYIDHLNGLLGTNSPHVKQSGVQKLDGVQAMAYCRIRYTEGDDFKRTERHRDVLEAILNKVITISPTKYPTILNNVFPMVKTNLSTGEILDLGKDALLIGANLEQGRFPMDGDFKFDTKRGMSCIVFDKDVTVEKLHKWIFEDIDKDAEIDTESQE